jgi:DNA-binding XRE family transcriptional regulator
MSKEQRKTQLDYRIDLGLTQEALAAKAGVSVETVFRAERDKKWPAMPLTRRKYIKALGLDPAAIEEEINQIHSVTV